MIFEGRWGGGGGGVVGMDFGTAVHPKVPQLTPFIYMGSSKK